MKPPIHDPSARQHSGEPSPVAGRAGTRTNRTGNADVAQVNRQIAELADRSTHELRLAWRQLHRTGPPQGLSRDLLIRALANQLQERTHGSARLGEQRAHRDGTRLAYPLDAQLVVGRGRDMMEDFDHWHFG